MWNLEWHVNASSNNAPPNCVTVSDERDNQQHNITEDLKKMGVGTLDLD